jgi:hypothetical protein
MDIIIKDRRSWMASVDETTIRLTLNGQRDGNWWWVASTFQEGDWSLTIRQWGTHQQGEDSTPYCQQLEIVGVNNELTRAQYTIVDWPHHCPMIEEEYREGKPLITWQSVNSAWIELVVSPEEMDVTSQNVGEIPPWMLPVLEQLNVAAQVQQLLTESSKGSLVEGSLTSFPVDQVILGYELARLNIFRGLLLQYYQDAQADSSDLIWVPELL